MCVESYTFYWGNIIIPLKNIILMYFECAGVFVCGRACRCGEEGTASRSKFSPSNI